MNASRWVQLENATIKRETDASFLIVLNDEEYWIPKSQVDDANSYNVGDTDVTLIITKWIAECKGL